MFVGIVSGALLYANGNLELMLNTMLFNPDGGMVHKLADSWNVGILIFLVILGILVALMNQVGGSAAFGQWASEHIKSRVGAQLATVLLGVLIFVDDYFNCLTVGSVMRPVTDSKNVSRAKLAFLIDATAAPICMIAPVSSWAAAVSGVASDLNVNGIELFINAIPFNFYSLLMIIFVIGLVFLNFDYGPMAAAELKAYRDGELGALNESEPVEVGRANLLDMILPVLVLIVFCIIGMLYVGGYWDSETNAGDIIAATGIDPDLRVKDMTEDDVSKIRDYIDHNLKVEGDLRRETAFDIKRLIEIGCRRGRRHKANLPVHGQRTKTNARTRKGPRRTVANKKK